MAYTIIKSDGTVLTTIPDGTINTGSTSLGLPGRNYAGYGQYLDTNFVHLMENFADGNVPQNPLRGQLWYDTNSSTLKVCPADGTTNAAAWLSLASTSSGGTTTFGQVTVTGNVSSNNLSATNNITGNAMSVNFATVTDTATIQTANIVTGNVGTLYTTLITTGGTTTSGSIVGVWTANGGGTANGHAGTAMWVTGGNLEVSGSGTTGIKVSNANCIMDLTGTPITFSGTYTNGNVYDYLTGSNSVTRFTGPIAPSVVTCASLTTGANSTAGVMQGNWTLSAGSRFNATYADLAERFAADDIYDAGTVVELGGDEEITAVKSDLSEEVFGVISTTAGYMMNSGAGDDSTHPAVAVGGRIPVKVTGKVRKGQRLVSAGNGRARAANEGEATAFNVIGRALAHKTDDGLGTVEAVVTIIR